MQVLLFHNRLIFLQLKCFRNIILKNSLIFFIKQVLPALINRLIIMDCHLFLEEEKHHYGNLTGVYASLSRVLNRNLRGEKYSKEDYHPPVLISTTSKDSIRTPDPDPPLSASSIWLTYEALQKVNRPESESGWQYFSSSPDLAWKTGTSFGFRDGWAVGTTPRYVVGVWVGNATGEGRPGLTGISAAAPLMFDLVNLMSSGTWFKTPDDDLTMIRVCKTSGFRAGPDCPETIEIPACLNGLRSEVCPYHQIVHLNKAKTQQVNTDCVSPEDITNESWFILPPAMEYFYRKKHSEYKTLPPVAEGCNLSKKYPGYGVHLSHSRY